ncbi:hypothetical protein V5O48_019033 [Marasmius crinis-equi]|uniref:Uncharacterized protein n=1 Tax=Marasmius crinis-equi TaxID=585013 RepID=A0ABR3EJJ4_9AGAR
MGSLFVEAHFTTFATRLRVLCQILGAEPGEVVVIMPEPKSRVMAASSKGSRTGPIMLYCDNATVRDLLLRGHIWSRDPGFSFVTRAASSTETSRTYGVWESRIGGMPQVYSCAMFRWMAARAMWSNIEIRAAIHAATPNDTRPLDLRVLETLASFDVIPLDPDAPTDNAQRFLLSGPPLPIPYERMRDFKLMVRQMDFAHQQYSFNLSPRYLPDRRALFCATCNLDWHVNGDCPLLALTDYNGPRVTITELIDSIHGAGSAVTAWNHIRQRAALPDLEEHSGTESDEYTPPTRGGRSRRGNSRGRGANRGRGRGNLRGRGRGRGF